MEKQTITFHNKMTKSLAKIETTKFVQVSLDKGQRMVKHCTPNILTLILLTGRISFTLEDEEFLLEPQDMVTVEPNREHALEALEQSIALLVLVEESKSNDL